MAILPQSSLKIPICHKPDFMPSFEETLACPSSWSSCSLPVMEYLISLRSLFNSD